MQLAQLWDDTVELVEIQSSETHRSFKRFLIAKSCPTPLRSQRTVACPAPFPWNFPDKNTGVGCHFLLQRIFLTQGSNFCLLPWQAESLPQTCPRTAAAAAAKSLQSCLTLCDPIDRSPPGPAVPGILQARTLEWVAISFSSPRTIAS